MFTVNVLERRDNKILYIKEINNSILINKDEKLKEGIYQLSVDEILEIIKRNASAEYDKFNKIIMNYISKSNIKMDTPPKDYSVYILCMHPSRNCNLSCKYCFAKEGEKYLPKEGIDIKTAQKAIDFLVDDYGRKGIKYQVDISGSGEPLLKFDFIKKLEEYCEEKSNETGKEIKITFPTNATLLNDEMVNYFNNESNILIGISLDGNARQSANRLLQDGRDAYSSIVKGAKLLNRPFGIAVTITHINEDVDEVYDHLYNEFPKADSISMQFVRNYDLDSNISFYKIDIDNVIYHYEKLVDRLFMKINNSDYEYVLKLLRGADTFGKYIYRCLNRGVIRNQRCGAGKGTICVDDNGDIYSCSVANGDEYFKIGSIQEGIDEEKQLKFKKANVNESVSCRKCWGAYICGGECLVKAYLSNKNIYEPNKKICELKLRLIEIAVYFVEKLKHDNIEAYNYLRKFKVDSTRDDTSLWVIHKYLKSRNIYVTYKELMNNAKRTSYGFRANDLVDYVKKYDKNLHVIKINNVDEYSNITYPAIAYVNKNKYYYQYLFINDMRDGNIELIDIKNDNVIKVPIKYFCEEISNIIMFS